MAEVARRSLLKLLGMAPLAGLLAAKASAVELVTAAGDAVSVPLKLKVTAVDEAIVPVISAWTRQYSSAVAAFKAEALTQLVDRVGVAFKRRGWTHTGVTFVGGHAKITLSFKVQRTLVQYVVEWVTARFIIRKVK